MERYLSVRTLGKEIYSQSEGRLLNAEESILTCWVRHATNNFRWVSDLTNLYCVSLLHSHALQMSLAVSQLLLPLYLGQY
jgi:hypothetical protein